MVNALLQVGYLVGQTVNQPLGYLAEEHPALGAGVEETGAGTAEELLRQQVEHLVGQLRRREHFVVAQVGQTGKYVGIVVIHSRAVLGSQ